MSIYLGTGWQAPQSVKSNETTIPTWLSSQPQGWQQEVGTWGPTSSGCSDSSRTSLCSSQRSSSSTLATVLTHTVLLLTHLPTKHSILLLTWPISHLYPGSLPLTALIRQLSYSSLLHPATLNPFITPLANPLFRHPPSIAPPIPLLTTMCWILNVPPKASMLNEALVTWHYLEALGDGNLVGGISVLDLSLMSFRDILMLLSFSFCFPAAMKRKWADFLALQRVPHHDGLLPDRPRPMSPINYGLKQSQQNFPSFNYKYLI